MTIDAIFDIKTPDPIVEYFDNYIVSEILSKNITREEQQLEAKEKLNELLSLLYPEDKVKFILNENLLL